MGARYDEDDELDYQFLRLSTRQTHRPADRVQQSRQQQGRVQQSRQQQGKMQQNRQEQSRQQQNRQLAQRAAALARRKRRIRRQKQLLAILFCVLLVGAALAILRLQRGAGAAGGQAIFGEYTGIDIGSLFGEKIQGIDAEQFEKHPEWTEDFLTISEYSRPGDPLGEVKNIFVHYTANPNTGAAQNRSYFENLKDMHDVPGASAHFIIGINGEILQIVPLDEMAYAVKTRNEDSISIECCYKADNGQFAQETYDSLIELLAWLADIYDLEEEDILRHYDCGGKKCPLYYVEHEDAWEILKQDVAEARK